MSQFVRCYKQGVGVVRLSEAHVLHFKKVGETLVVKTTLGDTGKVPADNMQALSMGCVLEGSTYIKLHHIVDKHTSTDTNRMGIDETTRTYTLSDGSKLSFLIH